MAKQTISITPFRLPAMVKKRLLDLAEFEGTNMTAVLIGLINKEYRVRKEEIETLRRTTKKEDN